MFRQRRREPFRQRQVTQRSTLRRPNLAAPVRLPHAELPRRQIDVSPFEPDDLAAARPGVARRLVRRSSAASSTVRRIGSGMDEILGRGAWSCGPPSC